LNTQGIFLFDCAPKSPPLGSPFILRWHQEYKLFSKGDLTVALLESVSNYIKTWSIFHFFRLLK
jgi:hypothetical protein